MTEVVPLLEVEVAADRSAGPADAVVGVQSVHVPGRADWVSRRMS